MPSIELVDTPDLSNYYTKAESDGLFALIGHNHAGVYSPVGHTHVIGDITNFPVQTGNAGKYLKTDGAALSWDTPAGGGGGSPGGADTQIQYNNAGAFGGSANNVWDNANGRHLIGGSFITSLVGLNVTRRLVVANDSSQYGRGAFIGKTTTDSGAGGGSIEFGISDSLNAYQRLFTVSGEVTNMASVNTRKFIITDNVTASSVLEIDQTGSIILGTWNATVIAVGKIGTGVPAAGKYVDGGTGAWTALPVSSIGGANTQIQFNDGGSFGGDADLTWDKTGNVLGLSSGATIKFSTDTGISRSSAGIVEINNGTPGTFADLLSRSIILDGAPPAAAAGRVSIGGDVRTTIGANGGASALTANPVGYLDINVAGSAMQIPYYTRGA
jgi:hypothetical protein